MSSSSSSDAIVAASAATHEQYLQYKPPRLKAFAPIQERETAEAKYWKKFKLNTEFHFFGGANCIDVMPTGDYSSYLVSGSTKVSLFAKNDKIQRTFARFNDEAYSGKFRKDGKLIVAGDKGGYVKVFDVKTKAVLRTLKSHYNAVHSTDWLPNGLQFISGSDDCVVKLWDLATQEVLYTSPTGSKESGGHTDYVRWVVYHVNLYYVFATDDLSPSLHTHINIVIHIARMIRTVVKNPVSSDVFVSGSYDHSAILWDARQNREVHRFQHNNPVEKCMVSTSGTLLFSAAANEIKVWDMISGGKLLHTFSNHQKNITSLAMNEGATRLLSAGLDGHVKIYNLQLLQVTHGIKYKSPILSLNMTKDNKKLIVGHVDGTLITRLRYEKPPMIYGEDEEDDEENSEAITGAKRKFYKGAGSAILKTDDEMIESERRIRLKPYEKQLKKFNYQKALDSALRTHNPLVVVTVLEELLRRSGLTIALSDRDETTLEPLLAFTARYVSHPRYAKLILQVVHRMIDLYADVLGKSDAIDELFLKLQRQVKAEVAFQRQAMKVVGALDGIIAANVINEDNSMNDGMNVDV